MFTLKRLRAAAIAGAALALASAGIAQNLAPAGCPVFHCTPEATGVMAQPIIQPVLQRPPSAKTDATLGSLKFQGCSGDGTRLGCLFATDKVTGAGKGTLKLIDAAGFAPLWGSDGKLVPDLDPKSAGAGQVPVFFSDGRVAAGDVSRFVRFDPSGAAPPQIAALTGGNNNFGMTPMSSGYGIVSQSDGVLTLIDLATWSPVDTMTLHEPATNARVMLVSPSSGSGNVLYAVGAASGTNRGLLMSVRLDTSTAPPSLQPGAVFPFTGRSGASPVVVTPAQSNLSSTLVLLHAPSVGGSADQLMLLLDNGAGFVEQARINLDHPIPVAPTIDQVSQRLYLVYQNDTQVHVYSYLSGAHLGDIDVKALAGVVDTGATFALNGHLGSIQARGTFTLLLAGSITGSTQPPPLNGQYVIAVLPAQQPQASTLPWKKWLYAPADQYTAAWNLSISDRVTSPPTQPIYCPVVVGVPSSGNSELSRLCF